MLEANRWSGRQSATAVRPDRAHQSTPTESKEKAYLTAQFPICRPAHIRFRRHGRAGAGSKAQLIAVVLMSALERAGLVNQALAQLTYLTALRILIDELTSGYR